MKQRPSDRAEPVTAAPRQPKAGPAPRTLVQQLRRALQGLAPKPVRTPAAVRLEALEPRLLLAGDPVATLNNGALTLALTSGADEVVISQVASSTDGGIVVDITLGGLTQRFGTATQGVTTIGGDGQGGDDRFTLPGAIGVSVNLTGGDGKDSLVGPAGGASWAITGNGDGILQPTGSSQAAIFNGFESVFGGSGVDRFNIGMTGALAGTLDGGGGSDALQGPDRAATYTLTGAGQGTLGVEGDVAFVGIESLAGGQLDDRFILRSGAALSGGLAGGGGTAGDTLIGPDANNTWQVTGADSGSVAGLAFSGIAKLTGGTEDDTFQLRAGGSISGTIDGGLDREVAPPVDTLDFSLRSSAVSVDLALASATDVAEFIGIDAVVGSSSSTDLLAGPGAAGDAYDWELSGANAGRVGQTNDQDELIGTDFRGFENLRGRHATSDSLLVKAGGSLTGSFDGGSGGGATDALAMVENGETLALTLNTQDAAGVFQPVAKAVRYTGIDPINPLAGDDANRVIKGSIFNETITVAADPATPGRMTVTFSGIVFTSRVGTRSPSLSFANPTESLTIEALAGADTINVQSLGTGFAADLKIYGNTAGGPALEPDPDVDHTNINGSINTRGGDFEAFSDHFKVADNVTLSTVADGTDLASGGDITVRARRVGTPEIENLMPVGYLNKSVSINIGTNATLKAGSIYLVSQAEDRTLADRFGLMTPVQQFTTNPALAALNNFVSLPIKVLVKGSESHVTIGTNAKLQADDVIGVYSTAVSNASGQAASQLAAVGYAQASATATLDVLAGASITANGPINLTSDGTAIASMNAGTEREEQGAVPGQRGKAFAASVAATWAQLTSTATVADTATIHGGRTVNVRALGEVESEAEAESTLYADGTASLSLALQFSTADVLTTVAGNVQADMKTSGGEVVKFEFDPTTTDPTQRGYVDYANNRILVYDQDNEAVNWVVVTEDTVDYSPRRGNSIGGLNPGTYYVIKLEDDPDTQTVDESHYIQLATTEQNAIGGIAVDLKSPAETPLITTSVNTRTFNTNDIVGDTIRLNGIGNTFELGQAVIYREPGHAESDSVEENELSPGVFERDADGEKVLYWKSNNPNLNGQKYVPLVPGLVHGGLYYVKAGVDQFNQIGDQRLVDGQTLTLGSLENETRGGIARSRLGTPAQPVTGLSLSATQILDSTFLTFGIGSKLEASDKATANAGFKAEKVDKKNKADDKGWDWKDSAFNNIFNKLAENYTSQANSGGANAKASLQVGGALAFSYTDHETKTLIKGTADLNSADDMELTSDITERLQLSAQSNTEAQAGKKGFDNKPAPNTSADNSISVAATIGVQNNAARAIVETGAELDSMRALRLLSGVNYPFLTRPDEFVPTSVGEFEDALSTEGYEFFTKYLEGSLGLTSGLLNTWARSTTQADGIGIAGSVNVLVFDNTAESIVQTGVKINQDPFYRPDPRFYLEKGDPGFDPDYEPDRNNDNITHSNNANNVDEHVVSIEATNQMQFVDMTGVFGLSLPVIDLSTTALPSKESFEKPSANPGATAERGGVGGAIFVKVLKNTTRAVVESGVDLYSGSQSGLNIKAEEAILAIDLVQAGAAAGTFAFGGSFSYVQQTSDTLAQLAEGSPNTGPNGTRKGIEGGRIDVYAGSLETQASLVGGVAKSKAIGAGIGVAINNTTRTTRAVIGEADDAAGTGAKGRSTINVTGSVTARASVAGGLYAFAVAGAFTNTTPDKVDESGGGTASGAQSQLKGVPLSNLPGYKPPSATQQKAEATTGVGLAASVGVVVGKDTTQASIADANITADAVTVMANNRNHLITGAGGIAFAKTSTDGSAVGLAGALSYNKVEANTNAFVRDASLTLRPVDLLGDAVVYTTSRRFTLTADNRTDVWTGAAGMAGALAVGKREDSSGVGIGNPGNDTSGAYSLAGSVGINNVISNTNARLWASTVDFGSDTSDADGNRSDALIAATDDSNIFSVAGSLSFSIATGGGRGDATALSAGVAVAINSVTGGTQALADGGRFTWASGATGKMQVLATASPSIQAYSMAGALSVALGTQTGGGIGGALAGSGSVNKITTDTTAIVRSSTVTVPGAFELTADARGTLIKAKGGSIAVAVGVTPAPHASNSGAVALGAAFAINSLGTSSDTNDVRAELDGGSVTSRNSTASVLALSNATIDVLSIGGAGAVGGATGATAFAAALGGSVTLNQIRANTQARVRNNAVLTSAGTLALEANDTSSITADSGGFALGVAGGTGNAVGVAVGLSAAKNDISGSVEAVADRATLNSGNAATSLKAIDQATIKTLTIGGALAVGGGGGNGVGVGLAGAGSGNTVARHVTAELCNGSSATAGQAVTLLAKDTSAITANAGGVGVGIGVGGSNGVGASLGVAIAINDIGIQVLAQVDASSVQTGRSLSLTAEETATIEALAVGGAVSAGVGLGGAGVGLAGAGSDSQNTVHNSVKAVVNNARQVAATGGGVTLSATDVSTITAKGVGAAVAVGGASGVGVAIAVGVSKADNTVTNTVEAHAGGSTITATGGDIAFTADAKSTITSITVGGALTVGAGGAAGVAAGGGAALSTNLVDNTVKAYADGGSVLKATGAGDNIRLRAIDTATVNANTVGAAVSIAASPAGGGALSIGVSIANSTIQSEVKATTAGSQLNAAGDVVLDADAVNASTGVGVAAALALAGAPAGLAVSGAGAGVTNTVNNTVEASITGAGLDGVRAGGSVSLTADQKADLSAVAGSGALSGGVVAGAIGISTATNSTGSSISSRIDSSEVFANGISISAGAIDTLVKTDAYGAALAIGISGAVGGGFSNGTLGSTVAASTGTGAILHAGSGQLVVSATSTGRGHVSTAGMAGAALAAGASKATATANGSTTATLAGTVADAAGVKVQGTSDVTVDAKAFALSAGVIAGNGSDAVATNSAAVTAELSPAAKVTTAGDLLVDAYASADALADAQGVNVGAASFGLAFADATVNPAVKALVGSGAVLLASGNLTVQSRYNIKADGSKDDRRATALATPVGGGVVSGAGNDPKATAAADVITRVGDSASLTSSGGNVNLLAVAHNDASTTSTGANYGGVSMGFLKGKITVTNHTRTVLGKDSTVTAARDLTVKANTIDTGYANGTINTGAIGTQAEIELTATINDAALDPASTALDARGTATVVAAGSQLTAGATLTVRSERDTTLRYGAKADGRGFGAGAKVTNTLGVSTALTTDIGVGSSSRNTVLRGTDVSVKAVQSHLDVAMIDDQQAAIAKAFVAVPHATTTLNSSTSAKVTLRTGVLATGLDSVTLGAEHQALDTSARAIAQGDGVGADARPSATNNLTVSTAVDAQSGASVRTRALTVLANADSTPTYEAKAEKTGDALIKNSGGITQTRSITFSRTIDFNASVQMLGGTSPELVVEADGSVSKARNINVISNTAAGIVLGDITNTGLLGGTLRFEITPSNLDSLTAAQKSSGDYGTVSATNALRGSLNVEFSRSFEQVSITNLSTRSLQLGAIDPLNASSQPGQNIQFAVGDRGDFSVTPSTVVGTTTITVRNTATTANTAPADIRLSGMVSNGNGSTTLETAAGSITSSVAIGNTAITSASLTLLATQGAIASGIAPLRVDTSNAITARAASGITLVETAGTLTLAEVVSTTGTVSLTSAGSIVDVAGAAAVALRAPTVRLNAQQGSIGTASNALDVVTGATGSALGALATGGIHIASSEGLGIGEVRSSGGGDIQLRVADAATAGQHLTLDANARITGASITLEAGDHVLAEAGSQIKADGAITVLMDQHDSSNPDVPQDGGSLLRLFGTVQGSSLAASGGADDDTFLVRSLGSGLQTTLTGNGGNDFFILNSTAGVDAFALFSASGGLLQPLGGAITIVGGGSSGDRLVLDARGNTGPVSGTLGASTVSGLGLPGTLSYSGIGRLDLQLGSGADDLQVTGTSASTFIFADQGDDRIRVGSTSNRLDTLAGLLTVNGGGGNDTVQAVASGSSDALVGTLAGDRLFGLGMAAGNESAGITLRTVESLDLTLGAAADSLSVTAVGTPSQAISTTVDGGGGADTLTVGQRADKPNLPGDLQPLYANLVVQGDGLDTLVFKTAADSQLTLDRSTTGRGLLTGAGITGTVDFGAMARVRVQQGDGADSLTVKDTNSALDILTGGGSDTLRIESTRHAVTADLGSGLDDKTTVYDAGASLLVTGGTLTVQRNVAADGSPRTAASTTGQLGGDTSAVISGLTTGAITASAVSQLNVRLGSGNDVFTVDHAVAGLQATIDTGGGDDRVDVLRVAKVADGGSTVVSGAADQDTVRVVFPGRPAAGQFGTLAIGAGVERLEIDNHEADPATRWNVVYGAAAGDLLEADIGTAGAMVEVMKVNGAGQVSLLGGKGIDALQVDSRFGSAVQASMAGQRIDLTAGQTVLAPSTFRTLDLTSVSIDFDGDLTAAIQYREDGFSLTGSAAITLDRVVGPSLSGGGTLTLAAQDGGSFALYSMDLQLAEGSTAQDVKLTAITIDGRVLRSTATVLGDGQFARFDLPAGYTLLSAVQFDLGAARADHIVLQKVGLAAATATAVNPLNALATTFGGAVNVIFNTAVGRIDVDLNRDNIIDQRVVGVGNALLDSSYTHSFNGTLLYTNLTANVAQFRLAGDFVLPDDSVVRAVGSNSSAQNRGLSVLAANDVLIGQRVTFEANAQGTQGGAGGGQGGANVGSAGAGGGGGGGGFGGSAGSPGGSGGLGGAGGFFVFDAGQRGGDGDDGGIGNNGGVGRDGNEGAFGTAGINSSGGRGGAAGIGGFTLQNGLRVGGPGGSAGAAGAGGAGGQGGFISADGGRGGGAGGAGGAGTAGRAGDKGGAGAPGTNQFVNVNTLVGGGGGGAGGGGGGGAGGGGSGGGGAGGGGGGGGSLGNDVRQAAKGAKGSDGIAGVNGGSGGTGATGGNGGGGGGAFEITALGRVQIGSRSSLEARGANGALSTGTPGNGNTGGLAVASGSKGADGASSSFVPGGGGGGGAGGHGVGGAGGSGAPGGDGAGGAGGMVRISGTEVLANGITIDVMGGKGGTTDAVNGRVVLATNSAVSGLPTRLGTLATSNGSTITTGPTDSNLYVGNRATPMIAGLAGGAELYGLLNGAISTESENNDAGTGDTTTVTLAALARADDWSGSFVADGLAGRFSAKLSANISAGNDRDLYRVWLDVGDTLTVYMAGANSGLGTLDDTYLQVFGASGNLVAFNDDVAPGQVLESKLSFTASSSGYYHVAADSFDGQTGTYTLTASQQRATAGSVRELSQLFSDNDRKAIVDNAPAGALAAVYRMDLGPLGFDADYVGYDMVVFVNLTDQVLAAPRLGAGNSGGADVATAELQVGGVGWDVRFGGSGRNTTLTGLNPHGVWVTLVPNGNITVSASVAAAGGGSYSVTKALNNGDTPAYITAARPTLAAQQMAGVQAVAFSPDGRLAYAISTSDNALVALNAQDMAQRQTLRNLTETAAPTDLVLAPAGGQLYLAQANSNAISVFAIDASGNLSWQQTRGGFANTTQAVAMMSSGGALLSVGFGGLSAFLRSAGNGDLNLAYGLTPANDARLAGLSDVAINPGDTVAYAISGSGGRLLLLPMDTLTVADSASSADLAGASGLAVDTDAQGNDTIYVTARDGNSLSVYRRAAATSTLSLLQVLRHGVDGVQGLLGASGLALTPDDRYLVSTAALGNQAGVFQRQADGRLQFVQVLRNQSGGVDGLLAPAGVAISADGARVAIGAAGIGGQRGGVQLLNNLALGATLPAPRVAVTTFNAVETAALVTAGGDDTVTLRDGTGAATVVVSTGAGSDSVTLSDLANSTVVTLGSGNDTALLATGAASKSLVLLANAGDDQINVAQLGANSTATLQGNEGRDTVRVQGGNLAAGSTVNASGNDPTAEPGDTLVFDPQNSNPLVRNYKPENPAPGSGKLQVTSLNGSNVTRGELTYDTFEGPVSVIAAPIVSLAQPGALAEGQGLILNASVTPLGLNNRLQGELSWDVDGDGNFGDVVGNNRLLSWAELKAFGIDDGPASYRIGVRATNDDGLSTEAYATLQVTNTAPTLVASDDTGGQPVALGRPVQLGFSATDPGDDRVLEWRIDWRDGTTQVLGAGSTSASHAYATPGVYDILVSAVDEDSAGNAAATISRRVQVLTGTTQVRAGSADYSVAEGGSLQLAAQVDGNASGLQWSINGSAFDGNNSGGITGATPVLTWAQLQALGVNDQGRYSVQLQARFADGSSVVSDAINLVISNTAPTGVFGVSAAAIDEGGSATVGFSSSSDPSAADTARGLRYSFDFNNDGAFDIVDSTSATVTVPAAFVRDDGTLTLRGRVSDTAAAGAADATTGSTDYLTTLTVRNVAPTLNLQGETTAAEGTPYRLQLSASDPGADTVRRWTVAWGDGSTDTVDGTTADLVHAYGNDGPRTINVTAVDDDGSTRASKAINVANAAPSVSDLSATPVAEGGLAVLRGRVADAGAGDALSLTIDWGDGGAAETVQLAAGATAFELAHRYADDPTAGTASDALTIRVTVSDGQASANAQTSVRVDDVAPSVALQMASATIDENGLAQLQVALTDPGVRDSQRLVVDWGDGSAAETVDVAAGTPVLALSHRYGDDDPTATPSDNYTVRVQATDKDGLSGSASAALTVANLPPVISGLQLQETVTSPSERNVQLRGSYGDVGTLDSHTVVVAWGDGSSSNAVLDAATRSFSASHRYATTSSVQVFAVVATVQDDDGAQGSGAIDSVGSFVNTAPVARDDSATVDEDSSVLIEVRSNDSDADNDPLAVQVVNGPAHGLLQAQPDGRLKYTPDADFNGADSFSYRLSDGTDLSNTATVRLTVNPVNDAPTLVAVADQRVDEGSTLQLQLQASDVEGQPLSYSLVSGAGASLSTSGLLTLPAIDGPATVPVTVRVSDGTASAERSFNVLIDNLAPTVGNLQLQEVRTGNQRQVSLSGAIADAGLPDTHTVQVDWGDGSSSAAVVDVLTRTFSASHSYTLGSATQDFTIVAKATDDDGDVGSASTVSRGGAGTAPEAVDDSATVAEDGTVRISVLANDRDAEGDALTLQTLGTALHGSVVLNNDGTVQYTPAADFNGSDSFTYRASDASGPSNLATVRITVTPVNDAPTITTPQPVTLDEGQVLQLQLQAQDVDGDAIGYTVSGGAGTVQASIDANGLLTLTGLDGAAASTLTITANDAQASASTDLTVQVRNVAPTLSVNGPSQVAGGTPLVLDLGATDPGRDTISQWRIDWGDGVVDTVATSPGQPTQASHVYGRAGGAFTVQASATDEDGTWAAAPKPVEVSADLLNVVGFTPTATGFAVRFDHAFDPTTINLHDSQLPDVVLTGERTGVVRAANLVLDADNQGFSFVRSQGTLVADRYSVQLRSGADGFHDPAGALDGNNDGTAGDDYRAVFDARAAGQGTLSLPDFMRGPGQAVDVPATGQYLPLTLTSPGGLNSLTLSLAYDASLLTVTGVLPGSGLPAGTDIRLDPQPQQSGSTRAELRITLTLPGAATLPAGALQLLNLQAQVPAAALYGAVQVLDLSLLQANGSTPLPGAYADDDAVHVVGYFGDTTGDAKYSQADVTLLQQVVVKAEPGFAFWRHVDPVIVADIAANNALNSLDASRLLSEVQFLAGSGGADRPEIPPVPAGIGPIRFIGGQASGDALRVASPVQAVPAVQATAGLAAALSVLPTLATPVLSATQADPPGLTGLASPAHPSAGQGAAASDLPVLHLALPPAAASGGAREVAGQSWLGD